jgi:hypothetical protein
MNELSWLPNHLLKGITLPKIIYEDKKDQNYGGYYSNNTLMIVASEDFIASTIAHEFKHYLQDLNNELPNTIASWNSYDKKFGYEKGISNYFKYNKYEYEALLFEYKYAKTDINEWWLRKLVHNN